MSVRGSRAAATTPGTTQLSPRQLASVPRRTAEDALRLVPGMTLVQHGSEGKGYQYFLRGFDAVHGTSFGVSLLGIQLNEWSNIHANGYLDLGFIIPEAIRGVTVTKGPFLLEQGAFALAGSADYQLGLLPSDVGLRASVTAGTTGRLRGLATYAKPGSDGTDFVALEGTKDDGFGQNRAIEHGTVLGLTRVAESPRYGTLSVLTAAYVARFGLPGSPAEQDVADGVLGFYDTYDAAQRGASERGLLGLVHEWQGDSAELRSVLYAGYRRLELLENYTGFLVDPVEGDRRRQIQRTVQTGLDVGGRFRLLHDLDVLAGLSASVDSFSQEQSHIGRDLQRLATNRELAGAELAASARAGVHWHPFRATTVTAGARFDLVHVDAWDAVNQKSTRGDVPFQFSPRVTATWQPLSSWHLLVSYGRGFRPAEAQAFTASPSAPAPIPDASSGPPLDLVSIDSAELGMRWSPSRYLGLRLIGFGNYMPRELVFDHVSGITLEMNGTRRLGFEAGLSSNPTDFLTLAADVTWVDARFLETNNPIPFAPWLTGSLHAIVTHESGFRAGLRLLGLAPRQLTHGAVGHALVTLDATAGYSWQHYRLDLELENPFDLRLREGESYFASVFPPGPPSALPRAHYSAGPPRNARLTLTVVF